MFMILTEDGRILNGDQMFDISYIPMLPGVTEPNWAERDAPVCGYVVMTTNLRSERLSYAQAMERLAAMSTKEIASTVNTTEEPPVSALSGAAAQTGKRASSRVLPVTGRSNPSQSGASDIGTENASMTPADESDAPFVDMDYYIRRTVSGLITPICAIANPVLARKLILAIFNAKKAKLEWFDCLTWWKSELYQSYKLRDDAVLASLQIYNRDIGHHTEEALASGKIPTVDGISAGGVLYGGVPINRFEQMLAYSNSVPFNLGGELNPGDLMSPSSWNLESANLTGGLTTSPLGPDGTTTDTIDVGTGKREPALAGA